MGDETMAAVGLQIPKTLIEDTIRASIVRAMGNQQELVERVVRAALDEKSKDESYRYTSNRDVPTVLQHEVAAMIREEAKRIFQGWLEEHRKDIAGALVKHLSANKAAVLKKFAESLVENMNLYRLDVKLNIGG